MLNFKKQTLAAFLSFFITLPIYAKVFELNNINEKKSSFLTEIKALDVPMVNEQTWKINKKDIDKLLKAKMNQSVEFHDFPIMSIETNQTHKASQAPITLTRYNIFAKGAKVYEMTAKGKREIPRPNLRAFSSFRYGIGLTINPKTGQIQGYYNHQGIGLEIGGNIHSGVTFNRPKENSQDSNVLKQCSMKMSEQPLKVVEQLNSTITSLKGKTTNTLSAVEYEAKIAVDTDNEWMSSRTVSEANTYIANMFVNMNVFFERDFSTRLLLSDVILRTATDPYSNQSSTFDYLAIFGEEWKNNQTSVDRDFALLLSAQIVASNQFSGIAWLDLYCENGFSASVNGSLTTVGSYSVNAMGSSLSEAFVSQLVAHELGHNFGSPHTHCYSTPIDNCTNSEASSGCFSGTESCPASGSGTIMSYCHLGVCSPIFTNNETFHPTVISFIGSKIVDNAPPTRSCLDLVVDNTIFANGFESP